MGVIEESRAEEKMIAEVVKAGLADIQNGRYTTVATREDAERLLDRLKARLSGCCGTERSGPSWIAKPPGGGSR